MKSRFKFGFPAVLALLLLTIAGSAFAVEDNWPPNGQIPAFWAVPPGAVNGWSVASDSTNGGSQFSLKSGPLTDDPNAPASARKQSAIETGGNFSAGTISFAYQVSSEANFDFFEFYVDGQLTLQDSGAVSWKTVSFPVSAGNHIFRWQYNKDNSNDVGSDAAWIDTVVLPPGTVGPQLNVSRVGTGNGTVTSSPGGITCGAICTNYFAPGTTVTLTASAVSPSVFAGWSGACAGAQSTCQVAMNAVNSVTATFNLGEDNFPPGNAFPPSPWATPADSNAPWTAVANATNPSYRGGFSLRSGVITDNGVSSIQETQTVPAGTIDFAYKVSSEAGADTFAFYIDDVLQTIDASGIQRFPASGEVPWTNVSFNVTAGTHVFKWQYQKDADTAAGSDASWIDSVVLPPSTKLLTVTRAGAGSGTITDNAGAINCGATCTAFIATNTMVTLTASPASGSTFAGWLGACTGLNPTCQVTMSAAQDVTASFYSQSQIQLSIAKAGNGSGTISSSPAGINCGATCAAGFTAGASVTLTATPDSSSTFTGWSGACAGNSTTCLVTVDSAKSVTATFSGPVLTVTKSGAGTGTVTSDTGGINCGATCSASYAPNTVVTLTAAAASGSLFSGWSGSCSGTTATCQVTMDFVKSVTATFSTQGNPTSLLSVTKQGTGTGTVTSNPSGISCGATCSFAFNTNAAVTLTAAVSNGVFSGWGGACSGTSTTCQVTMDSAKSVTATFSVSGASGTLDIDGSSPNSKYDALTDGLLVIRYLFGLTGTPLITGAIGPTATRTDAVTIKSYLDSIRGQLDVDGNGTADALTDGLLIIRYMFGLRGTALTNGAVGSGAVRPTAATIEPYIQSLMP